MTLNKSLWTATARPKAQRGRRQPDLLVATPGGAQRLHPQALAQLWLPVRDSVFEGHVRWAEVGQKFSWRMMPYSAVGDGRFLIAAPDGKTWVADTPAHLDAVQAYLVFTKPERLLQHALAEGPLFRTRRWRGPYPCRCREKRERQALAAFRGPGQIWRPSPAYAGRRRTLVAASRALPGHRRADPRLESSDYGRAVQRDDRCTPVAGPVAGSQSRQDAGNRSCPSGARIMMYRTASTAEAGPSFGEERCTPQPEQPGIGEAHPLGARREPARKPAEIAGPGAHSLQHRHRLRSLVAPAVKDKDHSLFQVAAFMSQLHHQIERLPAVDETQRLPDHRFEPRFRDIEAAEWTFAVIEKEWSIRNCSGRTAGFCLPRCHDCTLRPSRLLHTTPTPVRRRHARISVQGATIRSADQYRAGSRYHRLSAAPSLILPHSSPRERSRRKQAGQLRS